MSSEDEEVAVAVDAAEVDDLASVGGTGAEEELAEDDLFGDGDEVDLPVAEEEPEQRVLDDEDLDSGDDEGRTDRVEGSTQQMEDQTFNYMDADIARHCVPEPSDGELYLLKVPPFLAIEPTAFSHKTFQPPLTDHHSKAPPSEHFSAFNTATTTVRWRRSPSDHTKLQSNARVLRWADGSLTLQFANDPLNQYEINANMLAPPQAKPRMPVPIQVRGKKRKDDEVKEGYTYLVAPYEEANVMRVTNKFTMGLQVVPTMNTKDAALEKLQNDLASAANRGRDAKNQAISFIDVKEDPELQRQREELQFKQKLKQQRAQEKHTAREQERNQRTFRGGAARSSGLNIGMLENEEGGASGGAKKPRGKTSRHRDWSDDEDEGYGRGRTTKEDEYDDEDDFIAPSEEEPEIVEDDEDDDDGIVEKSRRESASPKRNRGGHVDSDDDVRVTTKKRRVVVDDEDDDE